MDIDGAYAGFEVEMHEPGIAYIRFGRGSSPMNGFTAAMKADLVEVISELGFREDARVIIFAGDGGAFSAGDDFTAYYDERHWKDARSRDLFKSRRKDQLGVYDRLRLGSQKLTTAIYETDLITIAAIDGPCIQSAFSLALACDFRIATPGAKLGSGTLRFGFQPDENGHYLLVRQIGVARTLDLLLNKRLLSGEEALAWGLVNEVSEAAPLKARAMEMALGIAHGPMVATRLLKRAVYRAYEQDFAKSAEDMALRAAISDHSPDTGEGVRAWRERRAPRFNAQGEDKEPPY